MDKTKLLTHADAAMDPGGTLALVAFYFYNKYWPIEMTADEIILIGLGLGALRTMWERWKKSWKHLHATA